jgi:hypothetical protein
LFLVRGEQDAIAHEASLPAFGQILIASELRKLGFSISPAGVRSIEARRARYATLKCAICCPMRSVGLDQNV